MCDAAIGVATPPQPMTTGTLHQAWCLCRPALALLAVRAVEDGQLDLARPLAEFADTFPALENHPGVVGDVLAHNAGLVHPNAEWMWLSPAPRDEKLRALAWREPMAAYSEVAGWAVIVDALERAYGMSVTQLLELGVLAPLNLTADLYLEVSDGEFDSIRNRIGVYHGQLPWAPVPLLHDRLRSVVRECHPELGGLTTTRGIGAILAEVAKLAGGGRSEAAGLPSFDGLKRALDWNRGRQLDAVFGRACDFAAGFMVGLADHGFGDSPSPGAFGHLGWMGSSFALVDPQASLACAVLYNGVITSTAAAAVARRPLVSALYRDLGL